MICGKNYTSLKDIKITQVNEGITHDNGYKSQYQKQGKFSLNNLNIQLKLKPCQADSVASVGVWAPGFLVSNRNVISAQAVEAENIGMGTPSPIGLAASWPLGNFFSIL